MTMMYKLSQYAAQPWVMLSWLCCLAIVVVLVLILVYAMRRLPSHTDTPLSDEQLRARLREINLDLED